MRLRYLPLTEPDRQSMLKAIGVESVDDLYKAVPASSEHGSEIHLPPHSGELEVDRHISGLADKNRPANQGPFFLGAGCYYHHIPSTVDYIIQRSEFLTSYTPYQPEVSQGTLTALFEFQTMVARLTGMEVANASMYDGATSMAEAAMMARRLTKRDNIHLHGHIHPHYIETLKSYMVNYEEVEILNSAPDEKAACVIVQTPDFHGQPQKLDALRAECDKTGALLVVVFTEVVSLGLLPAPTQADIVVGEGQSVGVPMSFGGPHLGLFATKQEYLRQMPGRLCGETVDADGKRSYVLTLSTREQHIRREKATSNICTNQGLCALSFTVHMSLLGENGFKQLAKLNHAKASELADMLEKVQGVKVRNTSFFNEFVIDLTANAEAIADTLSEKYGIIAGLPVEEKALLVTATEMTTTEDMTRLCEALKQELSR